MRVAVRIYFVVVRVVKSQYCCYCAIAFFWVTWAHSNLFPVRLQHWCKSCGDAWNTVLSCYLGTVGSLQLWVQPSCPSWLTMAAWGDMWVDLAVLNSCLNERLFISYRSVESSFPHPPQKVITGSHHTAQCLTSVQPPFLGKIVEKLAAQQLPQIIWILFSQDSGSNRNYIGCAFGWLTGGWE